MWACRCAVIGRRRSQSSSCMQACLRELFAFYGCVLRSDWTGVGTSNDWAAAASALFHRRDLFFYCQIPSCINAGPVSEVSRQHYGVMQGCNRLFV